MENKITEEEYQQSLNDSMKLPAHLGGHLGMTHVDEGILRLFRDKYNCKTLVDIGCGPGGQCYLAEQLGYEQAVGIDGDFTIQRKRTENTRFFDHDYTTGPLHLVFEYDLAWANEFLEHIEEQYISNFMKTFKSCKYAAVTCHPPSGKKNKWHFNEQNDEYWINIFSKYHFIHKSEIQAEMRIASTMKRNFFRDNGLVFANALRS